MAVTFRITPYTVPCAGLAAPLCLAVAADLHSGDPAPLLSALSAIRPDAALLELASLPGGFCPAAAERAGYLAARGLPGVYAPEAAAAVIRRAIFRELDLEECP